VVPIIDSKDIILPNDLAKEKPKFSRFVRFENEFNLNEISSSTVLEVSTAWEGVEVFVSGTSVAIQIVPTYLYEIAGLFHSGKNQIAIKVATTLERERAAGKCITVERLQALKKKDPTGIMGIVNL